MYYNGLLLKPGPGSWTLDPDHGSGPSILDPDPVKTFTLKNLDPEKLGINIGLENMSDFRELRIMKTIRNVSYCLKSKLNFSG